MAWTTRVPLTEVPQDDATFCAPACVTMLRSTMLPTGPVPQATLYNEISAHAPAGSPFVFGDPYGVAYTVGEFAPQNGAVPFEARRTRDSGEACAALASRLRAGHAATALVHGGTHWIVAFAASGDAGDPAADGPFSLGTLRLCNPDDGYWAGYFWPGLGAANAPSFIEEETTYAAFLATYFDAVRTPLAYGDGRNFVIVMPAGDARGSLLAPEALHLERSQQIDIGPAIAAILATPTGAALGNGAQQPPILVQTVPGNDWYFLVPFNFAGGTANVLRLDMHGVYMGSAFNVPQLDLRPSDALELVSQDSRFRLAGPFRGLLSVDGLVWAPSIESTSPYAPFYRVRDGEKTGYVSFGRSVLPAIHDRVTRRPIVTEL